MCLAVPAKIVSLDGQNAVIETQGVQRSANVSLVPGIAKGDYVIVHAGFAIQQWSQEDVQEYNKIMSEMSARD